MRKEWSISLLVYGTKATTGIYEETLLPELKAFAASEGRSLAFRAYYADRDAARLEKLAAEVVAAKPDVVIAIGTTTTRAVAKLTTTIPIVAAAADPVRDGFARSYASPGGNITGITGLAPAAAPKTVEILKRLAPQVRGFTFLVFAPKAAGSESSIHYMGDAARAAGLEMRQAHVTSSDDVRRALEAVKSASVTWGAYASSTDLPPDPALRAKVAIECKVPLICTSPADVESGGLFYFGAGFRDGEKQMASMVGSVLRGARPAAIPFRLPDTNELAINRRTASALGLVIPNDLELTATQLVG